MTEPTKVHITGLTKELIDKYRAFAEKKGFKITQPICIEALVKAGFDKLTGKQVKG